jgi:hypothetical protein
MTVMKLRREAPGAQVAPCCVCDAPSARSDKRVSDQLVVGEPGTPTQIGGVCETCGEVLNQVVKKFGSCLTLLVEQVQTEASDRDVAVGRVARHPEHAESRV